MGSNFWFSLPDLAMAATKPTVLVLGGCGFIGRNLVAYLVKNELCSHIRVVDKVLPSVAYLGPIHSEAFASPLVKFKQGNAQSGGTCCSFIFLASALARDCGRRDFALARLFFGSRFLIPASWSFANESLRFLCADAFLLTLRPTQYLWRSVGIRSTITSSIWLLKRNTTSLR